MNVGAFVCGCGGTTDLDLEGVREGVDDVEVVASSSHLCEDGLAAMGQLVEEYDLQQLVVTAEAAGCKRRIRDVAEERGLHPDATAFVSHRELAGWVHDGPAATEKVSRMLNATTAGLEHEAVSRAVSREAGESVAVVGDPETAAALADTADVTLVAHGHDLADADVDLSEVSLARGHVVDVDGRFGAFELEVSARVTEDCVDCMHCVEEGPADAVTRRPVDIAPGLDDPELEACCPVDAIDLDGVTRTLEADQVVYPGAEREARGGRIGFYTAPIDGAAVAAIERLLGGVTKPKHLDFDMDVCAAGDSSQRGCTACTDACPHDAVARPSVDEVEFDEVACQNCGACTSSCPTGAVSLREPSNERIAREVETLLAGERDGSGGLLSGGVAGIETPVVAFVCSERAERALRGYARRAGSGEDVTYPPVLPVRVNCTDTVGEAHVMHALAAGADGVAIVGCGADCLHAGPDPKAELVDRLNTATSDLGLGERVAFLAPEPGAPGEFVEELSTFVGSALEESPIPAGEHEASGVVAADGRAPEFNSHDWTLESVRAVLEHVDPERDVIRGLKDFGRMTVSDACNLTPTCSNLCPADAIRRTGEGDLLFSHEDCVNCGLCEEGCPETAITMRDGLDLSLLPENRVDDPSDADDAATAADHATEPGDARWVRVHEGEMVECVRCGEAFTSAGSVETVRSEVGDLVEGVAGDAEHSIFEYCGDCRARVMFDRGDSVPDDQENA